MYNDEILKWELWARGRNPAQTAKGEMSTMWRENTAQWQIDLRGGGQCGTDLVASVNA